MKPTRSGTGERTRGVAPLAGAWIETSTPVKSISTGSVAPLAGAWIETQSPANCRAPSALVSALLINYLLLPPLLLEAGWRHAEEIELRFVAIERGQQVWALPDHEKRITADWPDPTPPNADSRWRLTVWRGPLGTLAIPQEALRAEQGVAGRV